MQKPIHTTYFNCTKLERIPVPTSNYDYIYYLITSYGSAPLFLVLILFSVSLPAQKFASLGSMWTYQNFGSTNLGFPEVYQFRAEKDTVVDGRDATIVASYELYDDGEWRRRTSEIVSSTPNGDTVSVYFNGSFHLIYDFTAEAGDTIVVTKKPFDAFFIEGSYTQSRFIYEVDSVEYLDLKPEPRMIQYVSNFYPASDTVVEWGFSDITDRSGNVPGRIVKGVGSLNRFAMLGTSTDITFTFDNEPGYLACYEDSTTQINFANIDCDSLIGLYVSVRDNYNIDPINVEIYPNPVKHKLTIDYQESKSYSFTISNLNGQLLTNGQGLNKKEIELPYPTGIYHLVITRRDGARRSFLINKL